MTTSVDLRPCFDCGDAVVTCRLKQFQSTILTEIARNTEAGEEEPITEPIPEGVRLSMSFKYKDKSTKKVFECTEGIVFPPGKLTVTQS